MHTLTQLVGFRQTGAVKITLPHGSQQQCPIQEEPSRFIPTKCENQLISDYLCYSDPATTPTKCQTSATFKNYFCHTAIYLEVRHGDERERNEDVQGLHLRKPDKPVHEETPAIAETRVYRGSISATVLSSGKNEKYRGLFCPYQVTR